MISELLIETAVPSAIGMPPGLKTIDDGSCRSRRSRAARPVTLRVVLVEVEAVGGGEPSDREADSENRAVRRVFMVGSLVDRKVSGVGLHAGGAELATAPACWRGLSSEPCANVCRGTGARIGG